MNEEHFNRLIDAWRDNALTEDQTEDLNQILRESKDARRMFSAEAQMHGLLHCAVAEETVERVASAAPSILKRKPAKQRLWLTLASVAAAGLIVVTAVQWSIRAKNSTASSPQIDPSIRVAEVRYVREASLLRKQIQDAATPPAFDVGSRLAPGTYTLGKGLIELDCFAGASLAVEGPASFELISQREARLLKGRLTVEVDGAGNSFRLHTPIGEVLDIGTRYGVCVDDSGVTETHVFEGLVEIHPISSSDSARRVKANTAVRITPAGKLTSLSPGEATFPQPSRQIGNLLQHSGFERGTELKIGNITDVGIWHGDVCQIVGDQKTVRPYAGDGMLLFQSTSADAGNDAERGKTRASQLSQWIDLTPYKNAIQDGRVQARLSARFNRVAGDAQTDSQFSIHLESFDVEPNEAQHLQTSRQRLARSRTIHELLSDSNPESWERLEAILAVPANSRYLHVMILAFENVTNNADLDPEFDGHFADDLEFQLLIAPTSSRSGNNNRK